MALYISTGDGVVDFRTVDPYWGRSSRVWFCRSTGDGVLGYVAVDLYWGRIGRVVRFICILGTV